MDYTPHHTAISVSDIERTVLFYAVFGFEEVHRYNDSEKTGVKLRLKDYILEVFAYDQNKDLSKLELGLGNNLAERGVKHIAVTVNDVEVALEELRLLGVANDTTQILAKGSARFFFVRDPDGMWVEVIKDDRY